MDIRAWITMWISTLVWIIEDRHPKIMDIHVDVRGFLEIHAWICYGFSDQVKKQDRTLFRWFWGDIFFLSASGEEFLSYPLLKQTK